MQMATLIFLRDLCGYVRVNIQSNLSRPTAELPTQKKPISVLDQPYFSNFTTISVIISKTQERAKAT